MLAAVFPLPLTILSTIVSSNINAPLSDREKKCVCRGLLFPASLDPSLMTLRGPGLRIKRIQAKGQDVDTLQAKFDDIVREVEMKLLEAAIDHLRS